MKEANLTSSANHNLEHMYEELQQRATIDALSGVLNRATLEQCKKAPGNGGALGHLRPVHRGLG